MKTRFGRAAPVSTDTHDEVSGAGTLPTALLSPRRELLGGQRSVALRGPNRNFALLGRCQLRRIHEIIGLPA